MAKVSVLDRVELTNDQEQRLKSFSNGSVSFFHKQDNPGDNFDEIKRRIGDSEVVVTGWTDFPEKLIDQLPSVKMLSVTATSVAWIDIEAARKRGVMVSNVPGYALSSVSELVFGLALSILRKIPSANTQVKSGVANSDSFRGKELFGKTIGIIGTGNIGSSVARIAGGFGMNVIAKTKHPSEVRARLLGLKYVDLDQVLKVSDVVTIHVPWSQGNKETFKMIGNREFELMKPSAIFICTCRPEVYDEEALLEAIANKRIAGAGLDEIRKESIRKDNPLFQFENVVLTPEIGFNTDEALKLLTDIAIDNVEKFLNGKPQNVVNM